MTTIDRDTAIAAGVDDLTAARPVRADRQRHHPRVERPRRRNCEVGGIERSDVGLQIADNDDLNVLGMNFLSSLSRWGVEGRWLVLVS